MRSLLALLLLSAVPSQALACDFPSGQVQQASLYYELGSSRLTAMGAQTLEIAAEQTKGCEVLVALTGHVDASELASNPGLSQARIDDVRARLLAQGFAPDVFIVRDQKFSRPARATGPDIREPLNRRAELVIVVF